MTNSAGNRIAAADEGEYVNIGMTFSTLGLPAGANYVVRRTINGKSDDVTLNWGNGISGQGNWIAGWSLGYVVEGLNTVQVTLDATNVISETSETDNSLTLQFIAPDVMDPQFLNPLGGVPNRDWAIGNRVDLDPGPGIRDYRGNPYTYNGHDAHDIGLAASWQQQAAGNPIYASAGGKIVATSDGGDDKCGHPTANECGPNNGVTIDHGGGWTTWYAHMRKGSVAVRQGDIVSKGQFLGFVGSSGNSSGPHVHWAVFHNGVAVETYLRPGELLADPVPYTGEDPGIMDIYTAGNSSYENREEKEVFLPSETPAVWMVTQGIISGVKHDTIWYTPSGREYLRESWSTGSFPIMVLIRSLSSELGLWSVVTEVNGVKKGETKFLRTATVQPEVKVTQLANNFTQVLDETSIPVRFDPTGTGRIGPTRTLTVRNVGNSPLSTSGLTVPTGFNLVEGLSSVIDAGKEDTFTIQMTTTTTGVKSGIISFNTNDASESTYTFPIEGLVLDIGLSLSANSTLENAGASALTGTVSRPNFGLTEPMVVYLSSDDPSEAKVPLRVTIPSGQTTASFSLDAVDDGLLDGNRQVAITASLIGNVSVSATVTVVDFENLALVVTPLTVTENAGNGAFTATLTRSNSGNLGALAVNISSSDATAATVPATVLIAANAFSATFVFNAVNDAVADGNQFATITASASGFVSGTSQVTVVDDETATLMLVLAANSIPENGGTTTGTVTRNTPTTSALVVNLTSSDTTAATVPSTATIPAGATSATFTVTAVNDAIADGNQAITITATANGLVTGTSQLTVIDDETATLLLVLAASSIPENGGTTTGTVTRNTRTTSALIVNLTSSDTTAATVPSTVTIPAGATSATFTVTAVNDIIADGNLVASITATANELAAGIAQFTVVDDEIATLLLVLAASSLPENGGTTTGTVTRNTPTTSALVVNLTSSDTTAATVPSTVTIPAGAASATFAVTAVNDAIADGNQVTTITATANRMVAGTAQLTVVNDETAMLLLVLAANSIPEDSGNTTGTVTRNTPTTSTLIVNLTSSDTTAVMVPSTVMIPAGATSATFTVTIINDGVADGNQLTTVTATANGLVTGTTQLEVIDVDVATLAVNLVSISIPENGGTTTGKVTRNTPTTSALIVNLTSSDTTAATVPSTVTIPAGVTSATFTVTAVNDIIADGNQVASITATANELAAGIAQFTVVDDEIATLLLVLAASSLPENGGTTTGTVTRNTPATAALIVNLTTTDTTAATVPSTVTIPAGATSATFSVTTVNDAIADGNQGTTITASSNGVANGTAELTVVDDEIATLSLVLTLSSIPENGGTTIGSVTRNTPTTAALIVNLASSDTTAATVPRTVTIPADAASATFTVIAVNDVIAEGDKVTTLAASASGLLTGTTQLEVVEDDVATLDVHLISSSIAENGGTTTGTVTRNTLATSALIVNLTSSDTTAVTVPSTVTIPAGASSVTFIVTATDDSIAQGIKVTTLTVVATGFDSFGIPLNVVDDETAAITLSLANQSISENGGSTTATLTRNTPTSKATIVSISLGDPSLVSAPASVMIPVGATSATFALTAIDNKSYAGNTAIDVFASSVGVLGAYAQLIVQEDDVQHPWHNYQNRFDVNVDGVVSPIDALLVIAFLNAGRRGELPLPRPGVLAPPPYVDVNQDDSVSPVDALLVIDQLNRRGSQGSSEGESQLLPPIDSKTFGDVGWLETTFAELEKKKNRWR